MSYPHERQIEYLTSRAIEEYFAGQHYYVVVIPNSQRLEKQIPFDHLFAGSQIKVFGLQYKRLYNRPDHWRLDYDQHRRLLVFEWIYYALSEVRSIQEQCNALHLLKIVEPREIDPPVLTVPGYQSKEFQVHQLGSIHYTRWGGFVQALWGCEYGWQLRSIEEALQVFRIAREIGEALIDIYFVTLGRNRLLVRVSQFIAPVTEEEQRFDWGFELAGE